MADYADLATSIIQGVGGAGNISALEHCITRLRFGLADTGRVDRAALEQLDEVIGVRDYPGGIQIVIGQSVDSVYQAVKEQVGELSPHVGDHGEVQPPSGNPVVRFLNLLSECFVPLVPMLIATGLTSAIATLLSSSGLLDSASVSYQVLSFMGSAPLYFLPFMVAASAGKRIGVNIYITMAVMATLMYPNLSGLVGEGEQYIAVFGLPVRMASYSNSVFPALLVVCVQFYLEKAAKRVIPDIVAIFLRPLVTYLILMVLALTILGPAATFIGDGLAVVFNALSGDYRWLACLIFGALYLVLVSTGLHHSIRAVNITIFATYGFDPFWGGMAMGSNMALVGAVCALMLAGRDQATRKLAATTALPAFLGVTEPAIFGVAFTHRAVLISAMIGGGVAGLIGGLLGINGYGMGPAGIMSLALFVGPTFQNLIIAMVAGFAVGFVLSFVANKRQAVRKDVEAEHVSL